MPTSSTFGLCWYCLPLQKEKKTCTPKLRRIRIASRFRYVVNHFGHLLAGPSIGEAAENAKMVVDMAYSSGIMDNDRIPRHGERTTTKSDEVIQHLLMLEARDAVEREMVLN